MSTTEVGRRAESVAADFLCAKGCEIIAQNWRTRWYEIDVVAVRGQTVFFCEVKYRRSAAHGRGLDYVTPKKLQQMRFAAEFWVGKYDWRGEYELCAVEVSGSEFRITAVVKDL